MKTQNTNLKFNKSSLVELNDSQLTNVKGGTSLICLTVYTTSIVTMTILYGDQEIKTIKKI